MTNRAPGSLHFFRYPLPRDLIDGEVKWIDDKCFTFVNVIERTHGPRTAFDCLMINNLGLELRRSLYEALIHEVT